MGAFENSTNSWINSKIGTTIEMSGYTGTVLQSNLIGINEGQQNGTAIVYIKNNTTNTTRKYYFLISYLNDEYGWYEIENYETPRLY